MSILLVGAAGQLGTELIDLLRARGELIATDRVSRQINGVDWVELDASDAGKLESFLNKVHPSLIINAAAYTAVDLAESEPETAFEVNATLPKRLAHWAQNNDAGLIHYSTDYVFDGAESRPYQESDTPDPQNVYGDSKLAGERAILSSRCKHAILRTSWVYSSHGKNFVLSMLDLARRGVALKVVDDQVGCPTWARNLALASDAVIDDWTGSGSQARTGLFHYCDDQTMSWHGFADAVFKLGVATGLLEKAPDLTPIPDTEFPQPAKRPKWSVLDTGLIGETFDIRPVSFQRSLQTVISEIAARG